MNIYAIISLVAFVTTLILGIIIYVFNPKNVFGKAFTFSILFLLVVEFSVFMIFLQKDNSDVVLWGRVATSSFCFLPPTWALISLVYARSNYRELLKSRIWYLSLLFGIGLVFLIMLWNMDFYSIPNSFPDDILLITSTGKYFLIFAMLVIVITLVNFENTLRLLKISTRKGNKVPLYILMVAFLYWIYAISQMLMYSRISSQMAMAGFIVLIVTNGVLIFYTIRFGLNQLEVQIGREVVYSSVVVFIVGIYLLIIGIVGKIVQVAGGSVNLFLTFLAAFLAFCILLSILVSKSLKKRIKLFIDRNFYKERYDYREQWGNFSESLTAVLDFNGLLETILKNITEIFDVSKAVILLHDENTGYFQVKKTRKAHGLNNIKLSRNSEFMDWFFRFGDATEITTIFKEAKNIGLTAEEKDKLLKLQVQVGVPMIIQRKFVGILFLGEKNNSENFTVEDFELLETLANQSSIAILNAKLSEDLMVSREMEHFNKLSSFVLHDLKNSVYMLSMVVQNADSNWDNREFQQDMLGTITGAVNRMKSLISKMSTITDKLELNRKMIQINELIQKVQNDSRISEVRNIKIINDFNELPELALDPELIEKVVQNLLINSLEALPNGGRIDITTELLSRDAFDNNNGRSFLKNCNNVIKIEIKDSGLGMSEDFVKNQLFKPFKTTKKKGLGIGLFQCKEIVNAHGGIIEVDSILKRGTSFKIFLPVVDGFDYLPSSDHLACHNQISLN